MKVEDANKKFLGKRIHFRDITGTCNFLGYNEMIPSWGIQVTIGRTPVTHVTEKELDDIFIVRSPKDVTDYRIKMGK